MSSLAKVLRNLQSAKVTERQEALTGIRTAFAKDSVVENFHRNDDNQVDCRTWISVFNALFTMVRMEKQEYAKSLAKASQPKPAVLKRLGDVTSTVRWLVERAVRFFNKMVVQEVLSHLTGGMVLKDELLAPVVLDYAKALRCLLSFRPHLEHLSDNDWIVLVTLGFNVVLGDSPRAVLDEDEESEPRSGDDSFMYAVDEDNENDGMPVVAGKRKRGKQEVSASLRPSSRSTRAIRQISVSSERCEFAAILSILLGFSGSPILSSDYPHLPNAILLRLERILASYPAESSLLHDYLASVSSTLDHLALNQVHAVQKFAHNTWDNLIGLWGNKDREIRERLVVIIRSLLPYITADFGFKSVRDPYDQAGALWKLHSTLEGEADYRRGVEGLFLESLRLEIDEKITGRGTNQPFIAHTFRAGLNFETGQAVSWAVLEMQADCIAKLYQLSEAMNSGSTPIPLRSEKKRKMDNGISSVLNGIQTGSSPQARVYNLQVMLFFIDRHWSSLYHSLKLHIAELLLQLITSEDANVQSWAFLNVAAVAHAERFLAKAKSSPASPSLSQSQVGYDTSTWDSMWTHSVRRVNVPATCRAACHAGYALIFQASGSLSISLPSHRILAEIETLGAELEVQGPSYPYDSVCNFLSQCIALASQDVRLYRIHLEDKVISWMIDHWKVAGMAKRKLMPQLLQDGVRLLEAVCGLTRRSFLVSQVLLPSCHIAAAIEKESSEKDIQDFLLHAKLPSFERPVSTSDSASAPVAAEIDAGVGAPDLTQPLARERKVSAFLLRNIEALITEWENVVVSNGNVAAEMARRSLEYAVISLVFESLLVYNGVTSNRHLVQGVAKLISAITPLLHGSLWNLAEKATVLCTLEPIVFMADDENSSVPKWKTMLPPGTSSGIKKHVFHQLMDDVKGSSIPLEAWRTSLLRVVWQLPDAQECLQGLVSMLRELFCSMIGGRGSAMTGGEDIDHDDRDGFEPIKTVATQASLGQWSALGENIFAQRVMAVCLRFVAAGPLLRSISGEPTKDTEVFDTIERCGSDRADSFLLSFSLLLNETKRRTLNLTNHFQGYLEVLTKLFGTYEHGQSERLQQIATQLLHASLETWLTNAEIREEFRAWPDFLIQRHQKGRIKYSSVRDAFVRFIDIVVLRQPDLLDSLSELDDNIPSKDLFSLLPLEALNKDADIRVRIRVAILNARLFHAIPQLEMYPSVLYTGIQKYFNHVEVHQYEQVLSRLLALGNIIVASSAVRRGPYWHLMETCFYAKQYSAHIEAVLTAVSHCLDLNPSSFFEAYASQMGFSMIKSNVADIARIPPHLIGFEDRKQSAGFALSAFAPTYIASANGPRFEAHCKLVGVSPEDVFSECFGDIVGASSALWFEDHPDSSGDELEIFLKGVSYSRDFDEDFQHNVDGIAIAITRSLSDQEISPTGTIQKALQTQCSTASAENFAELVKYRLGDRYELHEPNLPAFNIRTVLRTLTWLFSKLPAPSTKAMTYHILYGLFAAIKQCPVVNEQLRSFNALAVWIALRHQDFDDPTLLHTLVQASTALLAEYDLARAAQSMLEWAFRLYRNLRIKDSTFSNIIIRICSIAYEYAQSRYVDFQELGTSLMGWVDRQALALSKAAVGPQVLRALPTWPYPPTSELAGIAKEHSSEALSSLLNDDRITYNKFRLVRRLQEHATQGDYLQSQFSKIDFWRLKDCVPSKLELQQDDVDAFASLLILNRGDIGSISGEYQSSSSVFQRYRRLLGRKASANNDLSLAREVIIQSLLRLLDNHTTRHVFSAYETLRRMMVVLDNFQVPSGSSDYNNELQYLRTYPRRARTRPPCKLNEALASEVLVESTTNFNQWISLFSGQLSDCLAGYDTFFAQLSAVLSSYAEFAAELLPVLIHAVLQTEIKHGKYTSKGIRRCLTNYLTSILTSDHACLACRQSIIDIVLYLRQFTPFKDDALSYNQWLELDYMLLAKNAVSCGAYTTALLFIELNGDYPSPQPENAASSEPLLYEIYSHIDEPDGFYSIQSNDLHEFLVRRFHHEKQWEKALQFHGAAVEADPANTAGTDGLLQAFSSFGFNHLVMNTLHASTHTSSSTLDYRLGWRTETWDLPERKEATSGSSLYFALRALHRERNSHTGITLIQKGLARTMDRLRMLGSENMAEMRQVVQEIMCLKQASYWRDDAVQNRLRNRETKASQWSDLFEIDQHFEFSDLEAIMATRISLLRSTRQKEERQQIGNLATPLAKGLRELEMRCLIRLSQAARDASQVQVALNSIMRAQKLENRISVGIDEEFASVLWEQKEQKAAIQYLQNVVNQSDPGKKSDATRTTHHALLLARLGSWIATACLEKPNAIWESYLRKAIDELDLIPPADAESSKSRATVYHDCALFAEQQYHATLKSPDAIRWKVYVERKRQEIHHRDMELASASKERKSSLETARKNAMKLYQEDSDQFKEHNATRDKFLEQALGMYARSLETADLYNDDAPIRFCSLWFANFENEGDFQVVVGAALSRIPSHKMVFLAHQLTARLSSSPGGEMSKSQGILQKTVLRMCQEHPFHSLYQLYCLLPERNISIPGRRQSDRLTLPSTQTERGSAAQIVFDRLRLDATVGEKVRDVESLCNACWQWAKYPLKGSQYQRSNTAFMVPNDLKICQINNLRVPVPTAPTPLDPTMRYDNCVWIESFEKQFQTAGGLNLPKISVCKGDDGVRYKQLFKGQGNDDLRQDAVMEQVFDVVNALLRRDRQTKRRELNVRGYKVIPLDTQAGLLEFVPNTMPLRIWLTKAHLSYHPKGMKIEEVRDLHSKAQNAYKEDNNSQKLLQTFHYIRSNYPPVMRHYFTEKSKCPNTWFTMRLKYTRSVATTSIVGHILGLGDRHTANILLDNGTGEIVHIDLGIAFDQGKLLPVPERVPFRMTANMVNGMGASGTQGVFQRCAEETLRVLRDRSDVIMTVLEVFKHDPLHSWTMSEIKVKQVQEQPQQTAVSTVNPSRLAFGGIGIDMSSGTAEEAADRALSSVARKVDKSLSVEYTVNQLIAEATDPFNLARIFAGWSPHT